MIQCTLSQCRHGYQQKEYRLLHYPALPLSFTVNCPLTRYITDLNDELGVGLEMFAKLSSNNYE